MNTHTLPGPLKLLGSSWQFYKSHWKSLTTLVLLPFAGFFIGNLISQIGVAVVDTSPVAATTLGIIGLVVFLAALVFAIAGVSGLVSGIHRLSSEPGHAVHFWNQYKLGFRYFWPVILIGIMRSIATLGSAVVFIIPAILFSVYSAFVLFSLIVDDKRTISAFTDSFMLVYGRWWKVLGRLLFIALVYVIAVLIVTGLSFLIREICGYSVGSLADGIVSGILMSVLVLVYLPFVMTYLYKIFHALKSGRFEGTHTKLYRELFIAAMVIGAVIFIGAIIFGSIADSDNHKRRAPYDSSLAVTASFNSHGNLVV